MQNKNDYPKDANYEPRNSRFTSTTRIASATSRSSDEADHEPRSSRYTSTTRITSPLSRIGGVHSPTTATRSTISYSSLRSRLSHKTKSFAKSNLSSTGTIERCLFLKQLTINLWKCMIVRRAHPISTAFELLGPIVFVFLAARIYWSIVEKQQVKLNQTQGFVKEQYFNPVTLYGPGVNLTSLLYDRTDSDAITTNDSAIVLWYAPEHVQNHVLFDSLQKAEVNITGVKDEQTLLTTLQSYYRELEMTNPTQTKNMKGVGVYVNSFDPDKGLLDLKIYLPCSRQTKMDLYNLYPDKIDQEPTSGDWRRSFASLAPVLTYVGWDFVRLLRDQTSRSKAIGSIRSINLARMPYPSYNKKSASMFVNVHALFATYLVITYVVLVPIIVKRITDEKSTMAKELQRMVGMSDSVFWLSHFVNFALVIVVHSAAITVIGVNYSPYPIMADCNWLLIFVVMTMFGFQLILFAMLITTIFNHPVLAVIVTAILWLGLSTISFAILVPLDPLAEEPERNPYRIAATLLPTSSIVFFFAQVGSFHRLHLPVIWDNLDHITLTYDEFTLSTILVMMMASYPLYTLLICYLDNVWPFQMGVAKSPFFCLKPSYWYPRPNADVAVDVAERPQVSKDIFEPDPVNLKPYIELRRVCKAFGSKMAVDSLWLNIYKNQITVLLGHNGAGKTTTMSMITGVYPPTSGAIYLNGYNMAWQTQKARRSLGLCPQENIIFNELTVYQHLYFFAVLKNYPCFKVRSEVEHILKLLQLTKKRNVLGSMLSGGMKRKLSLGIALVGGSRILVLDEPTSGLDPEARRAVWDLLIGIRRQRTILITTHYMEEADVLGDRIVIMNEGRLCCSGSPLFLKTTFGTGYQLRIEKLPNNRFKSKHFLEHVLRKYTLTAQLKSEVETEVIYTFPTNEHETEDKKMMVKKFPKMFTDLEENRDKYGIESFGMSYSTLEDVFLRVGSNTDLNGGELKPEMVQGEDQLNTVQLTQSTDLLTGSNLLISRCQGLLAKRFHFAKRYWPMVIFQLIIPCLIILSAMRLSHLTMVVKSKNDTSEIRLHLSELYGHETHAFYSGPAQLRNQYVMVGDAHEAHVHVLDRCTKNRSFASCLMQLEPHLDLTLYNRKYVTGLEVNPNNGSATVWYNMEQTLSLPLSLINAFEAFSGSKVRKASSNQSDKMAFEVTLSPMVPGFKYNMDNSPKNNIVKWVLICLIFLPIAFSFLAASYILYPIHEQTSKSNLLQLMTGVSPTTFWLANLVFDILYHIMAIGLIYLFIYFFDFEKVFFEVNSKASGAVLFTILVVFGFASIPIAYFVSFWFNSTIGGFATLLSIGLVLSLPVHIVIVIIELLYKFNFTASSNSAFLLFIFRLFPSFSVVHGYQKLYFSMVLMKFCNKMSEEELTIFCWHPNEKDIMKGCCLDKCGDECFGVGSPYSFGSNGCGIEMTMMALVGLVAMLFVILFQAKKYRMAQVISLYSHRLAKRSQLSSTKDGNTSKSSSLIVDEDSDVLKERDRVELLLEDEFQQNAKPKAKASHQLRSGSSSNKPIPDLMIVHDLTQWYGQLLALDHLTFGIHYNECFGLLGVNGAGKTTTFSILTGDMAPSSGNAYLAGGLSLTRNFSEFRQNIGYCPQFDALLDRLTGEETLYLFARLRGIPKSLLARDVANLLGMVGLSFKDAQRATGQYSGGMKRKLSIALALVGAPPLIFLDEPSAGVDPGARRKIWSTLGLVKRQFNSSIVLTSHSMEECEALCSRIAIMVSGRFRCLGSTQHLRTKYGQGYTILIRLERKHECEEKYTDSVQKALYRVIPSAELHDCHQCLLSFRVPDRGETWSNLFRHLAQLDSEFHFEDYVVSDTTLESIFIMFARSQTGNVHNKHQQ